MIEEIRITTLDGRDVFLGKIDLEHGSVQIDQDISNSLFAGFISAMISVTEEMRSTSLKEIVYQEQKLYLDVSDTLVFMIFGSVKIPTEEMATFTKNLMRYWNKEFGDSDFVYVNDKIRGQMVKIIEKSLYRTFWWLKGSYNFKNNYYFLKSIFLKPGASYFVGYLSPWFLITSLFFFCIPIVLAIYLGTDYNGFVTQPSRSRPLGEVDMISSIIAIVVLWITIPIVQELSFRQHFKAISYFILSGVIFFWLSFFIFFTSNYYVYEIYRPLTVNTQGTIETALNFLLIRTPLNLSYFGFLILLGYSTNNITRTKSRTYTVVYILGLLLATSITETILA